MNARLINVNHPDQCTAEALQPAIQSIQNGRLVCCPTETVYGLCANAFDGNAVTSIFRAKGRPSDNPLIVHISSYDMLFSVVSSIPPYAKLLMDKLWPGPISFVLPALPSLPPAVTAGLPTVAVRMPSHPVMLALITHSNTPLAAPSANISGRPSPTTALHCVEDLSDKVDVILDGGSSSVGLESTVVDVCGDHPIILRPGVIGYEELNSILNLPNPKEFDSSPLLPDTQPKCPGMKHRHYAPIGDVQLFTNVREIEREEGKRTAVIGIDELSFGSTMF
ncbi:hypothetical protein GEMRC1_002255 [Eukaryota sp. GEM-RC1]